MSQQEERRRAGIKDYTCDVCGEEFGSNCAPGDIECPNCESRLCPCCGAWFGDEGMSRPAKPDQPELAAPSDVHVDWHMTSGEWRQLYTDLWQHTDTPYIARLIEAGKIPAPPAVHEPPLGVRDFLTGRPLSVSETTHGIGPAQPPSPEPDGTVAIGPECFASADRRVISWRGINYYPWASDPDHQVQFAAEGSAYDGLRKLAEAGNLEARDMLAAIAEAGQPS